MREIKFRGKRWDNSEWVYGNLKRVDRTLFSQPPTPIYLIVPFEPSERNFRVEDSTVGQYTGLKDTNGVEIYEGDICHCPDGEYSGVVRISPYGALLVFCDGGDEHLAEYCPDDICVIGNIHDNPELLEGGEL